MYKLKSKYFCRNGFHKLHKCFYKAPGCHIEVEGTKWVFHCVWCFKFYKEIKLKLFKRGEFIYCKSTREKNA